MSNYRYQQIVLNIFPYELDDKITKVRTCLCYRDWKHGCGEGFDDYFEEV